jgi:tetratricopeptide (TPR) repeat protein
MRGRPFRGKVVVAGVFACACTTIYLARHRTADFLSRGEAAYRTGEWSAATEQARAVLKTRPADVGALRLLARASARLGKDDTAEALYRRLGTSAMEPEDLFLLGRGLMNRGLTGPGLASLGAARDADPDHPETLSAIISHLLENQTYLQAAQDAERLMHQPEWEARGMIALARARRQLLEPGTAADLLIGAFRRDPELTRQGADPRETRRLLAACLLEAGRPGKAREALENVLASGPDAESSWLLSRSLLMEGKLAEAKAALAEAQRAGKSDPLRVEPAPFVGAARCAACHAGEFRAQQQSRHARTIQSKAELKELPWPELPLADRDKPGVTHRFRRADDRIEAETRVEQRAFAAVVEYAMGSNHQGRSFVGRDGQGQARELRVSQYPAAPHWDRTSEHPAEPPGPDGYLGRPIADESVRRCVHCHSTNFRAIQEPKGRPEAGDHGIGCERCHGPGGHHLRAVEAQFPDLAIARPRLASAAEVVALCGQCHKAPESASPANPNFIRFQAPTLVLSRCYNESGSLSCVTCHNPHRDAGRNAAEYEAICLQCHPAPGPRPGQDEGEPHRGKTWAPCPVNARGDCLSCHMPRVPDAVPRAVFTDHHIRIRNANETSRSDSPSPAHLRR